MYTRAREPRTGPIDLLFGLHNSSYDPPITSPHIHLPTGKDDDAVQKFGQ